MLNRILAYIFRGILYCLGSFLQFKIIAVCKKEKDKTWQITIAYSISSICLFSWAIMYLPISEFYPSFSQHTGVCLCYVAAFFFVYFPYVMVFHSLVVSFVKYLFIVQQDKVLRIGDEKLNDSCFWFYLVHPFLLSIPTVFLYDFEAFESVIACFGLKEQMKEMYNTSSGNLERMFLCRLGWDNGDYNSFAYLLAQGFCALKMVYVLFLGSNICEAYFYFKIFQKMKR